MTAELLVAHCGLVCNKCGAFSKGKCQGCHSEKPMFTGCPVKKCCTTNQRQTCADCQDFQDLKQCKKLNNFISKIIGFFTRSNRIGKLNRLRDVGMKNFQQENK